MVLVRYSLAVALVLLTAANARAGSPAAPQSEANAKLAEAISTLIRDAIPLEYEKHDGWGATKEIVVGLRATGNLRDFDIKRRRKQVNHGVWKHYKLRMMEPEKNLVVQLTRLQSRAGGGVNFTLRLAARLDGWARAKVYERGIHLIALEAEGDTRVVIDIHGAVGVQIATINSAVAVVVQPQVTSAEVTLNDFHLRRISNAKGPVVRELGNGLEQIIEEELNGPKLTTKLNQAIDKRRQRLVFTASELLGSCWQPLSATTTTAAQAASRE